MILPNITTADWDRMGWRQRATFITLCNQVADVREATERRQANEAAEDNLVEAMKAALAAREGRRRQATGERFAARSTFAKHLSDQGYPTARIAALLGVSANQARRYVHRAAA